MWDFVYRDYPLDHPDKKEPRRSGRDIKGCEMNEIYGWSDSYLPKKKKH